MTPQEQAALDQALATMADTFPSMIHRYYTGLVQAGFSETQALLLTIEAQKAILSPMFTPRGKPPTAD